MGVSYNPKIVTDGLVFCVDAANSRSYPKTGTTWSDLAGANNGTLTNMDASNFSSDDGGSLSFDGSNEYASLTFGINTYDICQSLLCSVLFWVKTSANPSTRQCIFGDWNNFGNFETARAEFTGYGMTSGKIGVNLFGHNVNDNLNNTSTINSDVWYHVAATRNGGVGGTGNLYINAVLEDTISYTQTKISGSGTFAIGRGGDYNGLYLNGFVSGFQLYDRALSAHEVRSNYLATKGRYE